MKQSACLIFNPVAGQGDAEAELAQIRALLEPELELDICFTTPEISAEQLAQQAIAKGTQRIIASGGDGTLSAVASVLVESNIALGIISRGTANAFAAALGIPDTIPEACQTILQGYTRTVDAARCNDQTLLLLAGIGFEAETVEKADRESKHRFGLLAYILAGFQQLRELQSFDVVIETENRIIKTTAAAVTVANAAPPTSVLAQGPAAVIPDDGLLDLTIVAPTSRVGAIAATYHLLQTATAGNPVERDDIGYLRAKQFQISTDPPQKVAIDGELAGTTPVTISCLPAALRVYVPLAVAVELEEKLEGLPNLLIEFKSEEGETIATIDALHSDRPPPLTSPP